MRIRCFLIFSVLAFSAGCIGNDPGEKTFAPEKTVVELNTTLTSSMMNLSSTSSITPTLELIGSSEEDLNLCNVSTVGVKVKSVSECGKKDLNAIHLAFEGAGIGILRWGTADRESHFTIYCDGRKTDNHITLYKKITDTHFSQFNLKDSKIIGDYRLDFRCNREKYYVKDLQYCEKIHILLSDKRYCGETTYKIPPIENRTNHPEGDVECIVDEDCGKPYYSKCVCGAHGQTPKRVHYKPSCSEWKCITRFAGYVSCENGCLDDTKNSDRNIDNLVVSSPSNKTTINLETNSIGFILYVQNEGNTHVEDVSMFAKYRGDILLRTTPAVFGLSGGEKKKIMVNLDSHKIVDNETIRVWIDGKEDMYLFTVHVNETEETHVKCSLC